MAEHEHPLALLLYRLQRLEEASERRGRDDLIVERAMQHELHEIRHELPDALLQSLRADYYTKDAARNVFVTRAELHEQRQERREWPLILAGIAVALVAIVNLIVTLSGGK